ncbi:hypothetical protein RRG08_033471 [Elysia crispata]|uniref:Uncharacterized protein n=1 Tax=Elysia crispata TaxID=231223 RepID=A0AAE1ATT8_9GAST|nr:hypothetical protein RRG08_033471 [Elysia crispata]
MSPAALAKAVIMSSWERNHSDLRLRYLVIMLTYLSRDDVIPEAAKNGIGACLLCSSRQCGCVVLGSWRWPAVNVSPVVCRQSADTGECRGQVWRLWLLVSAHLTWNDRTASAEPGD